MKALRFVWALVFLMAAGCLLFAFWFGDAPSAGETPSVVSVAGPAEGSSSISSPPVPSAPPRFDYSSDALLALNEIEARHPIFVLDGFLEGYDEVRNTYLRESAAPMTKTEFLLATQRYLTVLQDGHMGSGLTGAGDYLDISWACAGGRLYLLDADGTLGGTEVTGIGGVPVSAVTAQVDRHYYSENKAARELNYAAFCRQREMLELAGCAVENGNVTLTTDKADKLECGFIPANRIAVRWGKSLTNYIIHTKMDGDVFFIDLRAFHPDPSVDSAAEAIRAAVEGGTRKFILDLRGNGGGNSTVGAQLLHAMGMTLPGYGVYIRNSEKIKETLTQQTGFETDTDPVYFPPDPSTAANPLGIELVVLTDEKTFSSATMTAIWVRDGKLGTLIGRPSSNAPCAFGDMTAVKLPVCGVTMAVSYKRLLRPDASADPDILMPDILTGRGEDAMQAALTYLGGK